MATYRFLGGDSFDDPNNWYNVTAGMPDDGVPGPNDTISGSTALIPAAGETVANAKGTTSKPVEISGGLTITGEGYDLWLSGGNYSIGTVEGGYIVMSNGATVTAGSVDLNQQNNTGLSLDGTSSLTVAGSVVAQGDNIDTSGTFDVDGGVSVTKATLEIDGGATAIGGALTLDSGSYLDLYQGSATVIGSLIVGKSGAGTMLIEKGGYVHASTLYDGSRSSSQGTGTVTVSGGNLGATAAYIGEHASGTLTVKNDGTVLIGRALYVGAYGHVTVSSNSGIAVDGTLTNPGFVTIGTGGTVTLDCVGGAYNANTEIPGGTLLLEQTGAIAETKAIIFLNAAGYLSLASKVTLSNDILGFQTGDTIELLGVTANKDIYNSSTGTLTLKNGNTPVETLHFVGAYTYSDFHLTQNGSEAEVTYAPSGGSAASIQEQIFNSALLSDSLGYHAPEANGERGSAVGSAKPDLWSVGHAPGGW